MTIQTSPTWAETDHQGNIIEVHSEPIILTVSDSLMLSNGNYVYYENIVSEVEL